MAARTKWDVTHACGHDQTHDLSTKRVAERADYAWRLARRDCSTGWTTQRDRETAKVRDAWIAERRAEKRTAIGVGVTRTARGGLRNSERAVDWARQVRHQLLNAAHDTLELDGNAFADQIKGSARTVKRASWWTDPYNTEPADLEDLLADGALDGLARTENAH